jgi:heme A synthase
LSDWASEIVGFRLVAGVLGAIALAAYFLVRRRYARDLLPAPVVDTLAVTLFGVTGLWMLGLGVDWLVIGGNGAGQWLGAAPVALVLAGFYGLRLLRDLRQRDLVIA